MEDQELIILLKSGSEDGMKEVMKKYGGLVKYIVIKIVGSENRDDIQECVSDIFYELWMGIERYSLDKGSFKNYIAGISRFKAINYSKTIAKNKLRNVPLEEDLVIVEESAEANVLNKLRGEILNTVLAEMKEPDREIFIRRYFWLEKIKDIAYTLNLNTKLVENTLCRGKQKLKKQLIERGIDGE